jgi:hypothetical protein
MNRVLTITVALMVMTSVTARSGTESCGGERKGVELCLHRAIQDRELKSLREPCNGLYEERCEGAG